MPGALWAGAASIDITPHDCQFLYGYPHVARYSTGVHDPLLANALYLTDDRTPLLFISVDIIFISKHTCSIVRQGIQAATGIATESIMISATHTHSGPITVDYISNEQDGVVPKTDARYITFLQERLVQVGVQAFHGAQKAKIGLAVVDSTGIGTNRHDPLGPSDPQVPVLMVKSLHEENIACLLVCSMHPTVLHEDSRLISADFPGMARKELQTRQLGVACPVLHHTGPAGDQSPRHVTHANTFAEAERLGGILASAVIRSLEGIQYKTSLSLAQGRREIDLPRKSFPSVAKAQAALIGARQKLDRLRQENAGKQEIRTAECDWFGAEETVSLARAAEGGRLDTVYASCLPAEIQIFRIGPWTFVGWPGEIFVEYSLAVKKEFADTYIISLANGELQGYLVTAKAHAAASYEAGNALFHYSAGHQLVAATVELLKRLVV